jgi:hypothetical protein
MEKVSPQYRSESAEIKELADRIVATAESHHRTKTTIPADSLRRALPEWSRDSIHSHNMTLELLKREVHQVVTDRDLDALRAYDKFDIEGHSWKLSNLKRVIHDLRYAGYQETFHLINQTMLKRAAKVWLDIFDEGIDERTALYGGKVTDESRESHLRTLRIACLVAPDDVAEYLVGDTQRAMNLVGERLFANHYDLIRVVSAFMDSETPVLAEGIL